MRRPRTTYLAATLAAIAGALVLVGLGGCDHDAGSSSDEQRSGPVGEPTGTDLHRSLELPTLAPGDECPRTAGGRPSPDVAIALGSGPAYAVLGFEGGKRVVELRADERRGGSYWHKTLWAIDPEYDGPVLIRGRGIKPSQAMGLGYDGQVFTELGLPAEKTKRWRYAPSFTILPSSGCYAFQVDGASFSEVIVFAAAESRERDRAGD